MSAKARHFRYVHISITLVSVLFLFQFSYLFIPDENDSVDAGEIEIDMDTVPNFDVQFMLAPDEDPLSELHGRKWARAAPGSISIYWIMITNMGPINDTYNIQLSTPPGQYRWYFWETETYEIDVHLTSTHVRDIVGGGPSFKTFKIGVETPTDALQDTKIPILVRATSESLSTNVTERAYRDTDTLIIVLGEAIHLRILPDDPSIYYMDPEETIKIELPMTNLGNKDMITVDLKVIEDDFWRTSYREYEEMYVPNPYRLDFSWTERSVDLLQGQSVSTELEVTVDPFWYWEDDIFQFRIFGSIRGAPNFYQSTTVTVIVNKFTELEAQINSGNEINIIPGEETHVNLSIRNDGYSEDTIKDIFLLEPDGVKLTSYNDTGMISDRFEIRGERTNVIDLGFQLQREFSPGRINRQLYIRPMYDEPIILNITLNVMEIIDLRILSPDYHPSEVIPMGPGQNRSLTFGIRNSGNTEQTVHIDLMRAVLRDSIRTPTSHEIGWLTSIEWISKEKEPVFMIPLLTEELPVATSLFEDDIGYVIEQGASNQYHPISIGSGETVWISFRITNPGLNDGVLIPPYPVMVVLSNEGDTILDEMNMVIDVKYPDLQFDGDLRLYDVDGQPIISSEPGEKVYFSINVTNTGDWYSTRTKVEIIAGGNVIETLWLIPLSPDQTTVLSGNFTVDDSFDSIRLEIDPENDLIEMNDQFMDGSEPNANTVQTSLSVKKGDEKNSALIISIILFLILVIFLALAGMFIYFRMKRDSPSPEDQ